MKDSFLLKIAIVYVFFIVSKFTFAEIPVLKSLLPDFSMIYKDGKAWTPTDFSNQGAALGLETNSFAPPKKMDSAVKFWISIYTEYQSHQGVLHDIDNLNVVYEKIDFDFIDSNSGLTESQKAKARENLLEERKKQIVASLKKLSNGTPEEDLSDFDKNLRKLWENQGGVCAIKQAAVIDRVRFQLGQSDRMKEAIFLSGRYLPMMEETFKNAGLPTQLTRLVFVESSFNVLARSKVGASGLWQIMPSAARGRLKVNKVVDLRNHPQKATELAAKMLKFNFEMLGSWPLAVTGYNHGPYGVKRLVERNKTRELGDLIETGEGRRFGFASRNFFASFLAALEVESKAGTYFPGIKQDIPYRFTHLKPKAPIFFKDLVEAFNGDRSLAQLYNPHLQRLAYRNLVPLDRNSYLVVPVEKKDEIHKTLESTLAKNIALVDSATNTGDSSSKKSDNSKGKQKERFSERQVAASTTILESSEQRTYKVNRGDTLYQISKQFGVSIKSILSANDLKRSRIRVGQVLQLP